MRRIRLLSLVLFISSYLCACTGGGSGVGTGSGSGGGGGTTGSSNIGDNNTSSSSGGAASTNGAAPNSSSTAGSTTQPSVDTGLGGMGSTSTGGGSGGGGGGGGGGDQRPVAISVSPGDTAGTPRDARLFNGTTDSFGNAALGVTVANTTSFQVVVSSSGTEISAGLLNPSRNAAVVLRSGGSGPQQTYAVFPSANVNTMPYPTNGSDSPVIDGLYEEDLLFQHNNVASPNTAFSGVLIAKHDNDIHNGTLRVNVYLVGTEVTDSINQLPINQAIDIWRQIYANANIVLDVTKIDLPEGTGGGSGTLPSVLSGSTFYRDNALAHGEYALNLFIGNSLTDAGGTAGLLGISSSIPGPSTSDSVDGVFATVKNVVAVDITEHDFAINNAPPDGVISGIEVNRLAETMAHESGHYLGLFHPVECNDELCASGGFRTGDLLNDTADCSSSATCLASGVYRDLMFPTPPGALSRDEIDTPQENLTNSQTTVLNLQVMVD